MILRRSNWIYDRMQAAGEPKSNLDRFSSSCLLSIRVECPSNEWIRLDKLVETDEEIFKIVSSNTTPYNFGLDAGGNIYVNKFQAYEFEQKDANISKFKSEKDQKRDEVFTNWMFVLAIGLVLILMRCS